MLAGQLSWGDPPLTAACSVRNLHEGGALIELSGTIPLPAEIMLAMPRDGSLRRARLIWRRGAYAGLAFEASDEDDLQTRQARQLRDILEQLKPR